MASRIDTVSARDKLKARHAPYWAKLRTNYTLGFRKTTPASVGSWIARFRDPAGTYQLHSLGALDQYPAHRRYDEAVKLALDWLEHRDGGGSATAITVADACKRYLKKLRDDGREATANDAEGRFKRWVYSDAKLSATPMLKLTPGILSDWRATLSATLATPQDKAKAATRKRSPATLNRDMSAFKAALNLALEDGYAVSSTAWDVKLRPVEAAGERREVYLDRAQRQLLIDKAAPDMALFIRALSSLPLRPGAVAARTVADFEPRLNTLHIGTDKNGKARTIPLPAGTAALIATQCKSKLPAAPIFARADGSAWNKDSWKGPIKDAVTAAGLPAAATAYSLRHSTITDLIVSHGLDLLTVARLADTSLAMIEKHYGHLRQAHAANALAKLAI